MNSSVEGSRSCASRAKANERRIDSLAASGSSIRTAARPGASRMIPSSSSLIVRPSSSQGFVQSTRRPPAAVANPLHPTPCPNHPRVLERHSGAPSTAPVIRRFQSAPPRHAPCEPSPPTAGRSCWYPVGEPAVVWEPVVGPTPPAGPRPSATSMTSSPFLYPRRPDRPRTGLAGKNQARPGPRPVYGRRATALAQETDILLLDEPTIFLDIAHQVEVLDLAPSCRPQAARSRWCCTTSTRPAATPRT